MRSIRREKRTMKGFLMLLRMNIVASFLLITILLLALSAQLSANHFSARRGHSKKLSVQKSSASHSIDLACQASQYPDLCKSSLRANSNISENAGPEEIIGAAMDLSSAQTTQSYLHSKQLLTTSTNANFTGAVNDCLEYLHDESSMSIQQAVNSAPDFSDRRFVIYVKTGVYEETVRVPPNKTNLMFVGDGMDKTVIRGSMSVPSLPGVPSTYDSATVAVNANGFLARDIAFENAAGPGSHQAVALRVDSDLSAFYNCAFLGHQDTLYTHTLRQFYRNCRIEGTVDFIFGNSAAIFENCLILVRPRQLKSNKGSSDPITAHGRIDPAQPTGFVFHNCTINGTAEYMTNFYANPKIYKVYLGRPWKMYSRVIFMNSYLGELISPKGWMPWKGDFALDTLYYGEYQNYGPGAKVSGRVPWSNQIPEINAGMYSIKNFIQGDEWLAATIS